MRISERKRSNGWRAETLRRRSRAVMEWTRQRSIGCADERQPRPPHETKAAIMIKWIGISLAVTALALIGAANYWSTRTHEEASAPPTLVTTGGHRRMICSVVKCWTYIDDRASTDPF